MAGAILVTTGALSVAAAEPPRLGAPLPAWTPGTLDIHQISTGRGNAALLVFPDGTSLLVDAGDARGVAGAVARPAAEPAAGAWVARYARRALGSDREPALDYAVVTHFHADHVGAPHDAAPLHAPGGYRLSGISEVAELLPIRMLIDRGYPGYDYPAPLEDRVVQNYRRFADWQAQAHGMQRARLAVGRADQVVLAREPRRYPDFEVRGIAASGDAWTGAGTATRRLFPPLAGLAKDDLPDENMCSAALRVRYGSFDWFTGGDMPGIPDPGEPGWFDVESGIARAVGPVDVAVVNHHGSIDPSGAAFLAALRPRVHVFPSWAPTHPDPSSLKRVLAPRAYEGPRDVFATAFSEASRLTIGARAQRLDGHVGTIVVRVAPGGARYEVIVLDDTSESSVVKAVFPYESR